MRFGKEIKVIVPAPDLDAGDLLQQRDAVQLLGVAQSTLLNKVNAGIFTVIWRLAGVEYGSARLLLRSEVERYATGGRLPGRGLKLEALPWFDGWPDLTGCEFGREVRMLEPLDVEDWATVTQVDALQMLGMSASVLSRQMSNGRFTVIWDTALGISGGSLGSRRVLLRSEVREAAAGGRKSERVNYRSPPVAVGQLFSSIQ